MDWDEPFPLNAVPPRVRNTILNEFKGRCPSIREVAEIPDSYWLATPNIGPTFLEQIRSVTDAPPEQTGNSSRPRLTDAELLERLERLQDELRWLQDEMEARLLKTAGRRPNRQWLKACHAGWECWSPRGCSGLGPQWLIRSVRRVLRLTHSKDAQADPRPAFVRSRVRLSR